MFRHISSAVIFVLCLVLPLSPAIAGTLYVSTTGQDTATGASTAPLKTFARACSLATPGDRIQLEAGTFSEVAPCSLASGVSVAGVLKKDTANKPIKAQSTVLINRLLTHQDCKFPSGPSEIFLDLSDKKNITISGIYFDGNARAAGQGVLIKNSGDYSTVPSNVNLTDVAFVGFHANAVQFKQTSKGSLSNAYIYNSSREYAPGECNARGYSNGNVAVSAGSTDVEVSNSYIETTGFYGYGLDGSGTRGTKILGNTFKMYPDQKWNSDPAKIPPYPGNFAIEFFGGRDMGVQIEGNKFDQIISLIVSEKNVVREPYSFLVKNNEFDIQREYAVELGASSIHVIGNTFKSSSWRAYAWIRNFGSIPGTILRDIQVINNVADAGQFSFFHSSWPVEGLTITGNTVTYRDFGPWRNRVSSVISGEQSAGDIITGNTLINFKPNPLVGLPDASTNEIIDYAAGGN